MPTVQVKTTASEKVWSTPDGQKSIFKVTFDMDGQTMQAKTYSNAIATVGWSGTVESYEKDGRNGSETFVKQPQREGGFGGGSRPPAKSFGGAPKGDNFTMYMAYAKDLAVAMLKDGVLDKTAYAEVLDDVIAGGKTLYDARPDAPPKPEEPKKDEIDNFMGGDLLTEESDPWKSL